MRGSTVLKIFFREEEERLTEQMKEEKMLTEKERQHLEDLLDEVCIFYSGVKLMFNCLYNNTNNVFLFHSGQS